MFDLKTLKSSQNMIKLCHTFTFQNMEVLCVIYAPLVYFHIYEVNGSIVIVLRKKNSDEGLDE
ncbi:unnamed protein product, partial [Nesidiocoris tenuis]